MRPVSGSPFAKKNEYRLLRNHQKVQFQQLLIEARTYVDLQSETDLQFLDELGKKLPTELTLEELFQIELFLNQHRPIEVLLGLRSGLEQEFAAVGGKNSPLSGLREEADEEQVRARFIAHHLIFSRLRAAHHVSQASRRKTLRIGICATIIVVAIACVILTLFSSGTDIYLPSFGMSMLMGLLGGLVSTIAPLLGGQISVTAEDDQETNSALRATVFFGPVLGCCFAAILYLIFASNIVTLDLFPKILTPDAKEFDKLSARFMLPIGKAAQVNNQELSIARMRLFLGKVYPASGQDFCKLMFWSFIAGYANRLVPDMLTKISQGPRK